MAEAGHLQKVRNVKVKRDDLEPYKDAFEVRNNCYTSSILTADVRIRTYTGCLDAATSVDTDLECNRPCERIENKH